MFLLFSSFCQYGMEVELIKRKLIIELNDKKAYISPYNHQRLNPDLLAYILDESKGIPLRHNIQIDVYSTSLFTEKEKDNFVEMLRSNLGQDIKESYSEIHFILVRAIVLSIVGIFSILLSSQVGDEFYYLIREILLIIGWIGIWEACYIFLFDNVLTKRRIKKYKQLVNAKVEFLTRR